MKIIFKNAEEKERVIRLLARSVNCPSHFEMKNNGTCMGEESCRNCWREVVEEIEVEI